MKNTPRTKLVPHLPDLMTYDDYETAHEQKKVRFRLQLTDAGLEIIGDSPYPAELDKLLAALDPEIIEKMACG